MAAVVLFSGCAPSAVSVWTDVPALVPSVELYNASQDQIIVELTYLPNLGSALLLAESPPDMAIGSFLENQMLAPLFAPLDRMIRQNSLADDIYPDLLKAGQWDGRQIVLPLSFELPLVYFLSTVRRFDEPIVISADEMRSEAVDFNVRSNTTHSRISYSPVWEPPLLHELARIAGMNREQAEDGSPRWDSNAIALTVATAQEWLEEHGGVSESLRFAEEYLYDPQIRLVQSGRVQYGFESSSGFLSLSDARRDGLSFRWLGSDDRVMAMEGMVSAGVLAAGGNARGAQEFLLSLLSAEFQGEVLRSTRSKQLEIFGFAGGFSSLWQVNATLVPEFFPSVRNMVPSPREIIFPTASPRHWGDIVTQVIEPWLVREVLGQAQARDLEQSVRAWLLQQEN